MRIAQPSQVAEEIEDWFCESYRLMAPSNGARWTTPKRRYRYGGRIMPDVVYYMAYSLDGYIATANGSVDWLTPFQSKGDDYGFADFYSSVDALVMRSHTSDNDVHQNVC